VCGYRWYKVRLPIWIPTSSQVCDIIRHRNAYLSLSPSVRRSFRSNLFTMQLNVTWNLSGNWVPTSTTTWPVRRVRYASLADDSGADQFKTCSLCRPESSIMEQCLKTLDHCDGSLICPVAAHCGLRRRVSLSSHSLVLTVCVRSLPIAGPPYGTVCRLMLPAWTVFQLYGVI
jgi:hypothetical protein